MNYHLVLFDYRNYVKWVYHKGDIIGLSRNRPGDMIKAIRARLTVNSDFLNEVLEVRRKVMRFDNSLGVAVYFIRLPQVRSFTNVLVFLTQRSG
jgi:hypothetical protein